MGLDLWFQEDVARILAATHETMEASLRASQTGSSEGQRLTDAYQQGFVDALRALAVAFGVVAPSQARQASVMPMRASPAMDTRSVAAPRDRWTRRNGGSH